MRVECPRRLSVKDLHGLSVSFQDQRRRLRRQEEASEVLRLIGRLLESNLERLKRVRQPARAVNQGALVAIESSKQGEMGIERRAMMPRAQVGNHTGEPVEYRTRRNKPKMKHTHGRSSMTYSTVTLFARFRGRSTSMFRSVAI